MLALSVYGMVVGVQVYNCGEHTTVSGGYIFVCAFMTVACPFGLYGASRVTSDVEAEIGAMDAVDAAKKRQNPGEQAEQPAETTVAKGKEDDGA